ncbi:MAG: MotA/TolQ/ExbB proton channel family protein [Bryobacteraceae bacterium]
MSTPAIALTEAPKSNPVKPSVRRLDWSMLIGIAIVLVAVIAGIMSTGVRLNYFFQPTGALIVLGGTFGVTFVTTPRRALVHSLRRVFGLTRTINVRREVLIEEILRYVKAARSSGLLSIESSIDQASDPFLKECLMLTIDVRERSELQAVLDIKIRLRERQGEADAKALEVAGGFAPTIGVIGTVVGLIDVLRQFSDLNAVAYGIGTAFVSTVYGLALANFVLLPAGHRIRAHVAERFEIHELIAEGSLCLFDRIHPALVRERLNAFLRESKSE